MDQIFVTFLKVGEVRKIPDYHFQEPNTARSEFSQFFCTHQKFNKENKIKYNFLI
jgi:hypothetical protein